MVITDIHKAVMKVETQDASCNPPVLLHLLWQHALDDVLHIWASASVVSHLQPLSHLN